MTGQELITWMETNGWSVAGLARAATISERTIYRWRQGEAQMPAVWDRTLRSLRTAPSKRRLVWRGTAQVVH